VLKRTKWAGIYVKADRITYITGAHGGLSWTYDPEECWQFGALAVDAEAFAKNYLFIEEQLLGERVDEC
jgi:hypothetical protein